MNKSMTDFSLKDSYSLILIPFRSFQLLEHHHDRLRCLQSVYRALDPNGRFILHLFRPKGTLDETWVYPERVQWDVIDVDTGARVVKTDRGVSIDTEKQKLTAEQNYKITEKDGTYTEIAQQLSLSYFYEVQIKKLLLSVGFTIEEIRNGFNMEEPYKGNEMVIACRK
ncbi:class I SAM-dependent methyltransferase [Evansella halocellulosilytica]|uniref:class I SAM-dependent methyltransferase n=1 Tax=Evansella halocellulosilytica TaxID=2011013 RepID=UPI0011558DEA|nr:class I SAM-dependent methyltransferase [Evansella halocellulosilytica]